MTVEIFYGDAVSLPGPSEDEQKLKKKTQRSFVKVCCHVQPVYRENMTFAHIRTSAEFGVRDEGFLKD